MYVERLRIRDFRCFETVDLEPSPEVNLITGDNASGKSSLLEVLFFLGRGQSFRPSSPRESIRDGCQQFNTLADVVDEQTNRRHRLAVQRSRARIEYRRDGETGTTRFELVNTLPLQLIDPNVHQLLEQGPKYRRHFMDWGVFHVEHSFFPAWRRYRRALRQRNRALKAHRPRKDVAVWDIELARQAEIIDASRRAYVAELDKHLPDSARRLFGDLSLILTYERGWRGDEDLAAALTAGFARDQRQGFTQQGPHRADFRVSIAAASARDRVSRGQQKLLTSALLLTQAKLLYLRRGVRPLLLVDDLAAELGVQYREALGAEIQALGGQTFVTTLDPLLLPSTIKPAKMFHVEHGNVGLIRL